MFITLIIIEKSGMKINSRLKNNFVLAIILICSIFFIGWGWIGHSIINFNTVLSASPEMYFFEDWPEFLSAHASDADQRKQNDPDEGPRHYIDIDNYPEFIDSGMINQNYDSLVAIHGSYFVESQGTLPWAILKTIDSLQAAFENGEWNDAMLYASDLGHYIGDDHMPLHLTRNYNGQYSGQNGIHSRYESNMIGQFSNQIDYEGDTLIYVENLSDYVFNIIYDNYIYVDSVLIADSIAAVFAGGTTGSAYYDKLWELTKPFTIRLFENASYKLTCLIYTAWVNAGSPVTGAIEENQIQPVEYELSQNYPNPFNPSTTILYSIPEQGNVSLKVFDALGREVKTLINRVQHPGNYEIKFNTSLVNPQLSSGVYYFQLRAAGFVETKKMLMLK